MASKRFRTNYDKIDWSKPIQRAPKEPRRVARSPLGAPVVMGDIAEFQSPIDYSLISSRSALREHEQKHGVRQCGELKNVSDFDNNAKDFTSAIPD